jgi:hypothetical protein
MAHREKPTSPRARRKWNMEHVKKSNKPLTLPGSELWKSITKSRETMQALDDTRTISDQARGRSYDTGFGAGVQAIYETPALEPLKIPLEVAGEGLKTIGGNPTLNRPQEPLFNERTDLKKYLEIMIGKSTDAREEVKYKNILAAVIAEDQADLVKEDIGGDNNAIQPRTWEQPFYGDERDELDPEVAAAQTKPSEGDFRKDFPATSNEELKKENKLNEQDPVKDPTGYQRPSAAERQKTRMEDALVRGRPGAKFKLDRERGRGTDINDLFTKNT